MHGLTEAERRDLAVSGYLVRSQTFGAAECERVAARCEALIERLLAERRARRRTAGSYVFELDVANRTVVKWEGDSDVVHGIEPLAHLDSELAALAADPRFTEPVAGMIGHPDPALFTEKLNLKRPRKGGVNPLHQDYPYWVPVAEAAQEVVTAMFFLDDATVGNGCLEVVPGSHRAGRFATRTDADAFAGNEIDVARYPDVRCVPVEVAQGSVVFFGAFLVHRSAPNTSNAPRRALLFSYQPPRRRTQLDALESTIAARRRR